MKDTTATTNSDAAVTVSATTATINNTTRYYFEIKR